MQPKLELYDLVKDPRQQTDLAIKRPEIQNRLKAKYDASFEAFGSR